VTLQFALLATEFYGPRLNRSFKFVGSYEAELMPNFADTDTVLRTAESYRISSRATNIEIA
jgi:hypothetical protein